MKNIFLSICLITSFIVKAQSQFDDYKYIVIPKRFDNFSEENQHKTSTLIKYLFTQKGFSTIYDDNIPADLYANKCIGLYVDLVDTSSLLATKASIVLKNCSNKEIFVTILGKSKEKEYKTAYSEVIREAMTSFDVVNYSYKPKMENKEEAPITVSFRNDIKKLDEKPKLDKQQNKIVKQEATLENQSFKDKTPVASNIKKATDTKKDKITHKINESVTSQLSEESVLYAQEIAIGYQLVDSTPKIQLKLYESSISNVYIAKGEDKNGLVYSKNEQWFFEYYKDDKLVIEELKIKF